MDLFAQLEAEVAAEVAPIIAEENEKHEHKRQRARRKQMTTAEERRTATREEREEAQRRLSTLERALDPNRVGCVVWWSASVVEVDAGRLRAALLEVDADEQLRDNGSTTRFADLVSPPVGPITAMRRAIGRVQASLANGLRWHDVGTRLDPVRGHQLVVALGTEEADAKSATWAATSRWSLVVDDATGIVTNASTGAPIDMLSFADSNDEHHAVRSLHDRYRKEMSLLTASDVGRIIVEALLRRLSAVRVKDGGSVYFVPLGFDSFIDRLAPAFALAGLRLQRIEVTPTTGATLAQDAMSALLEDAQKLADEAERAVEKLQAAKGGEGKRPKSTAADRRAKDISDLRSRAVTYSRLLGIATSTIDDALRAAEKANEMIVADYADA